MGASGILGVDHCLILHQVWHDSIHTFSGMLAGKWVSCKLWKLNVVPLPSENRAPGHQQPLHLSFWTGGSGLTYVLQLLKVAQAEAMAREHSRFWILPPEPKVLRQGLSKCFLRKVPAAPGGLGPSLCLIQFLLPIHWLLNI